RAREGGAVRPLSLLEAHNPGSGVGEPPRRHPTGGARPHDQHIGVVVDRSIEAAAVSALPSGGISAHCQPLYRRSSRLIVDVDTHWEATGYAGGGHPLDPWLDRLPSG